MTSVYVELGQPAGAVLTTDGALQEAGTPKGEAYCGACPAASCVCTEASFVNRSMLACPVPRLASPGAVQVDISVYRGADYSTPGNGAAIMLYVVPEPTSLFATI